MAYQLNQLPVLSYLMHRTTSLLASFDSNMLPFLGSGWYAYCACAAHMRTTAEWYHILYLGMAKEFRIYRSYVSRLV